MGLPSRFASDAGPGDGPHRADDPRPAAGHRDAGARHAGAGLSAAPAGTRPLAHALARPLALALALVRTLALALALARTCTLALAFATAAGSAAAGTLRLAVYEAGLTRRGPGLLLADLLAGDDAQAQAAARVVAAAGADVVLLTSFDYDAEGRALAAFAAALQALGAPYPYRFALRPNRGMATGLDLDGDGRRGGPADAQGWGRFAGARGMALLSRLPVGDDGVRDFSAFLWADLPGAALAGPGGPATPAEVAGRQRLASTGAWEVPVVLPGGGALRLLAFAAGLPLPGDADGRAARRNGDEVAFWRHLLAGRLPMPPPAPPFVLMGTTNLDPAHGAGRRQEMAALIAHPALGDPAPASPGGAAAGDGQAGDRSRATAAFPDPEGPGNLRLDYLLPWAGLGVVAAGVLWPLPDDPLAAAVAAAGRGRLVWVDLRLP